MAGLNPFQDALEITTPSVWITPDNCLGAYDFCIEAEVLLSMHCFIDLEKNTITLNNDNLIIRVFVENPISIEPITVPSVHYTTTDVFLLIKNKLIHIHGKDPEFCVQIKCFTHADIFEDIRKHTTARWPEVEHEYSPILSSEEEEWSDSNTSSTLSAPPIEFNI